MKSVSHRFTRQQLYDLVWESPITAVAKKLGVSDVAVAKACKKSEIPVPPRGYWARLHAGKHVIRIQLGLRGFGKSNEVKIGGHYDSYNYNRDWDADLPEPPSYTESFQEIISRAQTTVKRTSFPKTLANPHHLIDAALKEDESRRAELLKTSYYWKKPVFDTPEAKRKLKIINALFTVMTKVGEKPYLRCEEDQTVSAGVIVGETHVPIELEALHQKKPPTTTEKQPRTKPRFKLMIGPRDSNREFQTCWSDNDESKLEDQIRQISASLLVAGEMNYRDQAQYSYDWMVERKAAHEERKRQEQERKERERLEQLRKLERQRRRHLLSDILGWRRADEIRAFVAALQTRSAPESSPELKEKLDRWSEWALTEANQMDPMKRSISELTGYLPES